jgi:hypothetical protein
MALDPSIALSVKPVQLADPAEMQQQALTLNNLRLQGQMHQAAYDQAQQEQQQQRTLADLYKSSLGDNGQVDRTKLFTGAAQAGLGNRIPTLQKQFADADKATADVGHVGAQTQEIQLKMQKQKLDMAGGSIASLLSKPDVNHQDVISTVNNLVNQGIIAPEQGAMMVRTLPGNPAELRQFLIKKGLETMDASKRLEMMVPKTEYKDTGKQLVPVDVNPLTNQGQVPTIGKVTTPGEDLSAATTRRGQNMADSRERQLSAGQVTYQQDQDGNFVALPTRAAPGQMIKGTMVAAPGAGLQPLQGKSNMTEDQGKATGWLIQANNAWGNMQRVMGSNPSAASPGVGDTLNKIPLVGGIGNYVKGGDRQQFSQAASSLSEALLRAATGAGINAQEADQKIREITPQFGDSDAVITQKMKSIPLYLQSLQMRAGPGARKVPNGAPQPAADPGASLGGIDPGTIAAELARRGQK